MDSIIFSNEKSFKSKIALMKAGGLKSLHIIADFDLTLTKHISDGKKCVPTWEVFQLGDDYIKEKEKLINFYQPIEHDPNVSLEVKTEKINEWWRSHLAALIKYGLTKEIINNGTLHSTMTPRQNLDTLFKFTEENDIPFLILSAGLGDVISEFFSMRNMLYRNMHIISNFFIFDKNGIPTGFQEDYVHSYNKHEVHLRGKPYMKDIEGRKNVILLGDSPGDVDMDKGISHENVMKIGFLNGKEERLEFYKSLYDVIITEDQGVDFVVELLEDLK